MKRFLLIILVGSVAIQGWSATRVSPDRQLAQARKRIETYRHRVKPDASPGIPFQASAGAPPFGARPAPPFRGFPSKSKGVAPALVIGDDSPDESVTFTGAVSFSGDIVILNQGILRFQDATVALDGNIMIQDDGTLDMNGGSLRFQSVYRYQNGFTVIGNGIVRLTHATVSSNGYNLNAGFLGHGRFEATDTTFQSGLTTSLMEDATAVITGSNPLEWVVQDQGSLTISHSNGPFIFWPTFPAGSVADLSFPDGTHVDSFELSDSVPGVSGLGLSISLTDIGQIWWGMLIRSGADVTVRDSTMRTTGFIVDEEGDQSISGLVNGQTYLDHTFQVAGSRYRLVNTSVETWNVYAWGSPSLDIHQCLIGEFGGLQTTHTTLQNCLIDGTGGYLFTDADTETTLLLSSLLSDTVAGESSIQIFLYSTILNGDVVATDDAVILLLNTTTEKPPTARDRSLVMDLNVAPPVGPTTGRLIPLSGTADAITGPDRADGLDHWQLFYAPGDGSDNNWVPIGGPRTEPVRQDVLGMWDTRGLVAGPYTIKLSLTLQGGFSLDATRSVYLADAPVVETQVTLPHIASSILWQSWLTADNTSDHTIAMTAYRFQNGVLVGTVTREVGPGIQLGLPLTDGTCGFAVASEPGLVLKETFLHNTEQGMAEFTLSDQAATRIHFLLPHYLADRLSWMGVALMNPGTMDATVSLTARDTAGNAMQTVVRTLAPASRTAEVLTSMFPGMDFREVARIDAESDHPVTGITISGSGNERLLFTQAIPDPAPGTRILPHIAGNWEAWANTLVFDNVNNAPRTATLTLYGSGGPVASSQVLIPASGSVSVDLATYQDLSPEMGSIALPDDGVAVRMSYRSRDGGGIAEFLLDDASGHTLAYVLPGAFSTLLNWMGLATANPGDSDAHLTLTGWKNGIPVATAERTLSAHSRMVDVLSGLFAGISDVGLDRVVIASDVPITGLNISGWNQERLLFTPAVILPE